MESDIRKGVRKLFRLDVRSSQIARQDADEELEGFLTARIEQLVAKGMTAEDARAEALLRLGSTVSDARQSLRSSAERMDRRVSFKDHVDNSIQDMRQVARSLLRKPIFTATVILTLTLGIGATTSVFSIVNGVLLRALPFPQPEQLYRVFETAPPAQGRELRSIAIPTLADWRRDTRAFDGMALYGSESFSITGDGPPDQLQGATVSAELFPMLGAKPLFGRVFSADEELPSASRVAVLSYGVWQRRFGADSTIVGRAILLDRQSFQVIGIMPKEFSFPANTDIWAPIGLDREYSERGARHMSGIVRLKPNVSASAATSDLMAAEERLAAIYPRQYAERGVQLISLAERTIGNVRPVLTILSGAVLLVLLVTCTNIANLLVARANSRHREIGVRRALGASRGRIARQLLLESMLVFAVAGVLGTALSALIVRAVRTFGGTVLPRVDAIQLDTTVLLFALIVTATTGILFGLIPAVQGSSIQPGRSLFDGARGSTTGKRGGRLRAGMIVVETAMAAMLLVGAGLLVKSMKELRNVDAGLSTKSLLTFGVSLNATDAGEITTQFRQIRERIAAIPGVTGVALASRLPLSGQDHSNTFYLANEDRSIKPEHSAQDRAISAGYFRALGIRIVGGREFTDADAATSLPVAMVNESFARRWFGGSNVLGKRIAPTGAGGIEREIVGVVADTKQFSLDVAAEPEFYIPHPQSSWSSLRIAVRTQTDALRALSAVQAAVWSVDRNLPLGSVTTMEAMTAESGAQRRLVALALSGFALLTYLLAAVGLYGVIAYAVAQRTAEIGIRLALGANPGAVGWDVIARGMTLASIGALAGMASAIPLTRWLRELMFGVSATDAATYLSVGLLVPLVALVACGIPAARAARIDPASAMRSGE